MASQQFLPLGVRTDGEGSALRYVYVKPHLQESEERPRAAFVVAIPARLSDITRLTEAFGSFGSVEQIAFHPSIKSSAIIMFTKQSGLAKLLKTATAGGSVNFPCDDDVEGNGLKGWLAEYQAMRPKPEVLQTQVDSWMREFEEEEERKRLERIRGVEEGGWVTVEAKGHKKTQVDPGNNFGGVSLAAAERRKQRSQPKFFEDLYRFQQKDRRLEGVLALRQRFKEDQDRITEIRRARRFNPY
ncbi:hypothetical protein BSKO_04769 [Bryopsis sp. KO-2023]|nr:hypothetical protein BSKO_04769 [Bryopsis sp. KO-2023]